ncbi:protease Do [Marinicauda salina]|uniref:Protease Do n=1 Tax=Marinicauda salina TaxID=2135793 RepID=A0A2U2BSR7_9PROT|nr:Do family serine endopeptidase [Marinicauda salina]PWE17036.1 protease Do [Marinicauda salina]
MTRLKLISAAAVSVMAGALVVTPIASGVAVQETQTPYAAPGGAPMSFADLIEDVSPAVVSIVAEGEIDQGDLPDLSQIPPQFREFFERFGGMPDQPRERRTGGSGFFISADGLIVTNNHVVEDADEITITLADGDEISAELVGADPATDLALLRAEDRDEAYPFVTLDPDPELRVGDWVVAVGSPFGLESTATAGIISAMGRSAGPAQAYTDFLQIDAPINRGNSGGPAFDLNGNVVGVNSAIISPSGGNVGIGFAIPSNLAAEIVEQLIERGSVVRGYLGVAPQPLTADLRDSLGLPRDQQGVLLREVITDTPAAEAGLQRGDVVLEVDGEPVTDDRDLTQRIGAFAPGERVRLRILRDGEEQTVRVRLAERPSQEELANGPDAAEGDAALFGMSLRSADESEREQFDVEGDRGLIVTGVGNDSQAAEKGIRPGDLLLEAGGRDVSTVEEFRAAADEARERGRNALLVLVASQGGVRYVALQFEEESGDD